MKKKILLTAFNLEMGGISRALLNLLNNLDYNKYDITLLLQLEQGELLSEVNSNVKIESYHLSNYKNKFLKLFHNIFRFTKILTKHFHKYDFAGCFVSGYFHSALVARLASKNNAAWIHTNILNYMDNSDLMDKKGKGLSKEVKAKKFLKKMLFKGFKKNVFVSYDGCKAFLELYPENEKKVVVCHNLIDYINMEKLSQEKVDMPNLNAKPVFINVSRHTDYDKKLTRLINATEKLKSEGYNFSVLLIGDGPEHNNYVNLVKEKGLIENIKFLGMKTNPLPYYKIADAFVLTSCFEGFPVVFLESMVMNLPIITTDVSDAKKDIENKFGIVVSNDENGVYLGMKQFLDKGYVIKNEFDPENYNKESINILERMINNE